jgi:methyl acetate hydrolase
MSRAAGRALSLALAGCVLSAGTALAQGRFPDAGRAAVDSYLQQAVTAGAVPGVVAMVVDRNEVLYLGAFGRRDVARDLPMQTDSIFRIASMTKPITSLAVMMLVEAGQVGLDDRIADYLPEFEAKTVFAEFDPVSKRYTERPAARAITVRHLLTHTSGLGYAWSSDILYRLVGAEDASVSAAEYPLLHDPGAHWTYGESTRVLGRLVEAVSGESLTRFLQARIFSPLGMRDTGHVLPAASNSRLVTSHQRSDGRLIETPNPAGELGGPARGDGGLFSTAPDYARFLALFLNDGKTPSGQILIGTDSLAAMACNQIGDLPVALQTPANSGRSRPFPLGAGSDRFGLGFQITAPHTDPLRRSGGSLSWAGIQNTQFWIDPERGIAAVLLLQFLPFYDETAIEILQGFEQRIYRYLDARE